MDPERRTLEALSFIASSRHPKVKEIRERETFNVSMRVTDGYEKGEANV